MREAARSERVGVIVLLALFLLHLAGRFSLDRISASLPTIDLRWVGVIAVLIGLLLWELEDRGRRGRLGSASIVLWLYGAWVLWLIVSLLWSPPTARVGQTAEDLLLLGILTMLTAVVASRLSEESLRRVWVWVLVIGLIYFAAAMVAGPGDQGRYSAFGGGPNVFVRVMILGALGSFFLSAHRRSTWPLLAVPIFTLGAALSGSRGGMLSAGLVLIVALVPVVRRLGLKRVIVTIGILAAGGVIADQVLGGALSTLVVERIIQQTVVEQYSSGRDVIIDEAIGMFVANPIVGVGADGYRALQSQTSEISYPHNLVIASLAEGGIVGGALLVAPIVVGVGILLRRAPLTPHQLTALLAALFIFIAAQFSGDYYDSRFLWFFLVVALLPAPSTAVSCAASSTARSARSAR